jgi:hypothetical protein
MPLVSIANDGHLAIRTVLLLQWKYVIDDFRKKRSCLPVVAQSSAGLVQVAKSAHLHVFLFMYVEPLGISSWCVLPGLRFIVPTHRHDRDTEAFLLQVGAREGFSRQDRPGELQVEPLAFSG